MMKLSSFPRSVGDGVTGMKNPCSRSSVDTIRNLRTMGFRPAAFPSAARNCSTSLIACCCRIIVESSELSIILIDFYNIFLSVNPFAKQAAGFFHCDFEAVAHGRDGVRFHCLASHVC